MLRGFSRITTTAPSRGGGRYICGRPYPGRVYTRGPLPPTVSLSIDIDGEEQRWVLASTASRWGIVLVVAAVKGGNGGCCRVSTCLASINQWEWHLGWGARQRWRRRRWRVLVDRETKWLLLPLPPFPGRIGGGRGRERGERRPGPRHFWWMVSMMDPPGRLPVCHLCRLCLSPRSPTIPSPPPRRLGIHIQVVKPPRRRGAKKPWRELSPCPLHVGKH